MLRSIAVLLIAFGFVISARANPPASQSGAGNKPDQPSPADARKKLIAEIDADSEEALERLNQTDPGVATRARMQRVADNIAELLKQQDPSASQSPPPPRPTGSADKKPAPAQANEPKPQPAPSAVKPQQSVDSSKNARSANGIDEMKRHLKNGEWPKMPPRFRQEMDTVGRDRFIRNYEEMLRAYYRNIADSSRRDPD